MIWGIYQWNIFDSKWPTFYNPFYYYLNHKAKVELAKHGLMKTLEEVACCSENTDGDNLAKTVSVIVRKIQ